MKWKPLKFIVLHPGGDISDQWLNDLNSIFLGNKFIKNLNKGRKRVSKSYKQPKIKDVKK